MMIEWINKLLQLWEEMPEKYDILIFAIPAMFACVFVVSVLFDCLLALWNLIHDVWRYTLCKARHEGQDLSRCHYRRCPHRSGCGFYEQPLTLWQRFQAMKKDKP